MKTSQPAFQMPPLEDIASLLVARLDENTIQPDTPVLCLNRGQKPLNDTYDGRHLTIPPGWFQTEYGAAQHFQRRLIVPGTRTLNIGGYVSYIAIKGTMDGRIRVDPDDWCTPFSTEELQAFGEKLEGLDRSSLDPAARDVRPVSTGAARATSRTLGIRPVVSTEGQATEGAQEAAAAVFEPPTESATRQAEAEAAAEGARPARAAARRGPR